MLKENEIYTFNINDMNIFGNGVTKHDGIAVFVSGAVLGDTAKAKITKINKNYAFANVTEIITPSKHRTEPKCNMFGKCGGCSFLNTNIDIENEIKRNSVKYAMKKVGIEAEIEKTVAPVCEKYRNKVVLFYSNGAFGYKMKSSDKVLPHQECIMYPNVFDDIANFTAKALKNSDIRALFIRKSDASGQIMVCPIFKNNKDKTIISTYAQKIVEAFPKIVSVIYSFNNDKDFALENCTFEKAYGNDYIEDTLCGLKFKISPKSFYQINHTCAEKLYEKAIELAKADKDTTIADLFCGTGTIGIITAKRTNAKVIGVEIEKDAIKDAKENAKENGIKNIEFYADDASKFDTCVDVCIIDPPRKGCSDLMINTLLRLAPKRIVYVSCNPQTMARDISLLLSKYNLASSITPFNMFPRTEHIECVASFIKK